MSRFHSLLNRTYREIITEQDQPPVPPAAPPAPEGAVPDQAQPTPVPEIPEQKPNIEALSSEGMVFLVRLIGKALMIQNIDPDEEEKITEFGDINENNAKEALKNFMPIIQRYSPSVESIPNI
jgi:hypothetical protein